MDPLIWILPALLAGAALSSEVGYRIGRLAGPYDDKFKGQLDVIRNATFALVAFLIGFAFSGAATRYVDRLDVIVKEANALGTAWLRADVLPQPARGELKAAIHDYTADRIALLTTPDPAELLKRLEKVGDLQDRLWKAALRGTEGNPPLQLVVLPSINEVIDLHTTHLSAARRHIPFVIMVALLSCAALALALSGFGNGVDSRHFPFLNLMYGCVLSGALWMTIDLDYPRYGTILLNYAPLAETLASMKL